MIGVLSLDCTLVPTHKMLECDVQVSIGRCTFHLFMLTVCIGEIVGELRKDDADMKHILYIDLIVY